MRTAAGFTLFFGRDDPFSNWHPSRFVVDGLTFENGEQWMMFAKARHFGDQASMQLILEQPDPRAVKALGRAVTLFNKAEWDLRCEEVFLPGLIEKYRQNPELGTLLIATGDTVLVEASPYDRIWGIGLSENDPRATDPNRWQGLNRLGHVLMHAREALADKDRPATLAPGHPHTPPRPVAAPGASPSNPTSSSSTPAFTRSATMSTSSFASLVTPTTKRTPAPAAAPVAAPVEQPVTEMSSAVTEPAVGTFGLDQASTSEQLPVPPTEINVSADVLAFTPGSAAAEADADGVISDAADESVEGNAPAELAPNMVEVNVMTGFGDAAAAIYAGVVGKIKGDHFTIDPAYAQLSTIFETDGEPEPAEEFDSSRYTTLVMPEGDVAAFRANMIRAVAAGWDAMYASQADRMARNPQAARALNAERRRTTTKVAAYVASEALTSYDVVVEGEVRVYQDNFMDLSNPEYRATEAALVKAGRQQSSMARKLDAVPTPTPAAPVVKPLAEDLRAHTGAFELKVEGDVTVLAADAEQAGRVMASLTEVAVRGVSVVQNVLTVTGDRVQNATLVAYDAAAESSDEFDDDSDDEFGDDYRERG